jgi:hypothetical protein
LACPGRQAGGARHGARPTSVNNPIRNASASRISPPYVQDFFTCNLLTQSARQHAPAVDVSKNWNLMPDLFKIMNKRPQLQGAEIIEAAEYQQPEQLAQYLQS